VQGLSSRRYKIPQADESIKREKYLAAAPVRDICGPVRDEPATLAPYHGRQEAQQHNHFQTGGA